MNVISLSQYLIHIDVADSEWGMANFSQLCMIDGISCWHYADLVFFLFSLISLLFLFPIPPNFNFHSVLEIAGFAYMIGKQSL